MWFGQMLERCRRMYGERPAIIDGDRTVTFAELDRRTAALAGALLERGLSPGDRVALLSRNRMEVLEAYFALGRAGVAFVPLNPASVAAEVSALVERVGARLILGERDALAAAAPAGGPETIAFEDGWWEEAASGKPPATLPRVDSTDVLAILHTSATTGRPKGVVVDHRSLRAMSLGFLVDATPEDDIVFLNCNPLFHGAFVQPVMYMAAGATVALLRTFSPQACLAEIERVRATHVWVVPQMLRFLLRARKLEETDLSSLREVLYAAAPMPIDVLAEAHERLGCGFRQLYGMTEGGGPMGHLRPQDHDFSPAGLEGRTRSVGRVIPGMSMVVCDLEGRELPAGEIGEICVRGDGLMQGYLDDPEATAAAFRDGWLRTGDLGWLDEEGFVYLTGRLKDMIVRGGQKVFPAEVEQTLSEHPAVSECAVVGMPDEDLGEVPVAFAVLAESAETVSEEELLAFCGERLARYKRPVAIRVVSELPRTPAGKVLKRVLREELGGVTA